MAKKKRTTAASSKKTSGAGAKKSSSRTQKKSQAAQEPGAKGKAPSSSKLEGTSKSKTSGAKAEPPSENDSKRTAPKKKKSAVASGTATIAQSVKPISSVPTLAQEPESVEPVPKPPSEAQLRKVNNGLSRGELQHYRRLLLDKRAEILGDVADLEDAARTDSDEHLSPEHMADIGSNNYEQELTLGLVESERKMLQEIDEALLRIKKRTYGVCLERGEPIGKARLDAKPWAKYCIEVVREKERRGEM